MAAMVEIVMDGPGKNALGTKMMGLLRSELEAAGGAPVLLTGAGDAFCSGLNLKEVASLDDAGMAGFLDTLEATCAALFDYPGPTVAAVNGHAIAGGAVLALCCDVRLACERDRARIGLNEVAIGLRFPPGILRIVRHRLPARHLAEVLLGAGLHAPADAARLGLVDGVEADVLGAARARLSALAAHPPSAYAATKADLGRGVTLVGETERKRFVEEVLPVWTSQATKDRVRAALGH